MQKFAMLFALLGLTSLFVSAQVVVTQQGYATTSGPAVPATPVSPPVIFTPTVHLGTAPSTTYDANGVTVTPTVAIAGPLLTQSTTAEGETASDSAPVQGTATGPVVAQNFNFGVAQFTSVFGVGSPDDIAKSAAELKKEKKIPAKRSVTNEDIERINSQKNLKVGGTTDESNPNGAIVDAPPAAPTAAAPAAPVTTPSPAAKSKKK